ncbi:MAG: hypothetical protein IT447_08730 [Phycisphaerales bacterium]|nr:hypothetical protein [Phycisphaerales bacterium]
MSFSFTRWIFLLLSTIVVTSVVGCDRNAASQPVAPTPDTGKKIFRLQRINFPADSKYRNKGSMGSDNDYDYNSPPDLMIELFCNGKKVGRTSQAVEGWDVEFSEDDVNRYKIDSDGDPTFSIVIWDYDSTDGNDQILTISGLTAKDFESPIKERLGQNDPPSRAVEVIFKKIN